MSTQTMLFDLCEQELEATPLRSHNAIEMTARVFGRLTVIRLAQRASDGQIKWFCRCSCGKVVSVMGRHLRSGGSTSCGCLRLQRATASRTKHGHTFNRKRTKIYNIWVHMIKRCHWTKDNNFKSYGGRGISVCQEWREFEAFYRDMGDKPSGKSIERRDNNGNYEPGNCYWATPVQQARNRRSTVLLEFQGCTKCVAEWAEEFGISRQVLHNRLNSGWSVEKALTSPKRS